MCLQNDSLHVQPFSHLLSILKSKSIGQHDDEKNLNFGFNNSFDGIISKVPWIYINSFVFNISIHFLSLISDESSVIESSDLFSFCTFSVKFKSDLIH